MNQVTIGLIVRNGATTLVQALESLLAQTFSQFTILIADNQSTDATRDICENYVKRHPRLQYVRHEQDIGVMANALYVLNSADTPYFMWAAADDVWAPGYLEKCIEALEKDPAAIACQSRVLFRRGSYPTRLARGTYPLQLDQLTNIKTFLRAPEDNSRFYGVFRTGALKRSAPKNAFFAFDWAVSALTLTEGHHLEVPLILMIRDETPAEAYPRAVAAFGPGFVGRILPIWPMSREVLGRLSLRNKVKLAIPLARLNLLIAIRFAMLAFHSAGSIGSKRWYHPTFRSILAPGRRERLAKKMGDPQPDLFEPPPAFSKADHPPFTLVILACNRLQDVLRILTLISRTHANATDVMVVDRGSLDATALCLAGHPSVRFVAPEPDQSLLSVLQNSAEQARGENLVLIETSMRNGAKPNGDATSLAGIACSILSGDDGADSQFCRVVNRSQLKAVTDTLPPLNSLDALRHVLSRT